MAPTTATTGEPTDDAAEEEGTTTPPPQPQRKKPPRITPRNPDYVDLGPGRNWAHRERMRIHQGQMYRLHQCLLWLTITSMRCGVGCTDLL